MDALLRDLTQCSTARSMGCAYLTLLEDASWRLLTTCCFTQVYGTCAYVWFNVSEANSKSWLPGWPRFAHLLEYLFRFRKKLQV